jgi:hypothetical protein
MLWFLPRVLVLWLALIAICAAGVAVGRLDTRPDALQALGFDLCDGEPCYRGIKLGADWAQIQAQFPQGDMTPDRRVLLLDRDSKTTVNIFSDDTITVDAIAISHAVDMSSPLLGTAVARYGAPSEVELYFVEDLSGNLVPLVLRFIYPNFMFDADFAYANQANMQYMPLDYRVQATFPIKTIQISANNVHMEDCNNQLNPIFCGPWFGFASVDIYRVHVHHIRWGE